MFPNLVLLASEYGVRLALLNGSLPAHQMVEWHSKQSSRQLLGDVLQKYALIVPQSDVVGQGPWT